MEIMAKLSKMMGQGKMSKMDAKNLDELMKTMTNALKGTDLSELAKKMREGAEALAKLSPEELKKLMDQMKNMDLAQLGKMGGT
jgi:hypothetical protein